MYQPETEDLIPRCAPKPSASAVTEVTARPSVPEISIVFTQPESTQSSSSPTSATTSYATWKKQCLPQVTYPPISEIPSAEFSAMATRSNVYPMRTAISTNTTNNVQFSFPSKPDQPTSLKRCLSVPAQPQCSIEPPMPHCNPMFTVPATCCKMNYNNNQQLQSQPMNYNQNMTSDTLTICAGTQTDSFPSIKEVPLEFNTEHLATKDDISQLRTMLANMRAEQRRLIEVVQLLIVQGKRPTKPDVLSRPQKNISIQCEPQPSIGPPPQKRPHIRYDSIEEEDSAEEEDSYRMQKKTNIHIESPPKVPQFQPQPFRAENLPRSHVVAALPKPATEQSMVMNELALKYLPNEKLSELLQDLHVSPINSDSQKPVKTFESPLKNIENYNNKSPGDLSTASYKYLKKYRLLPEENNNLSPSSTSRKANTPNQQENMLDLDTIRRQPKFM